MNANKGRVLDVGNCDPDHGMIRRMLDSNFNVEIDRVMFVEQAITAMRRTRYDLVLVNRLIFDDGSEGIELHRRAEADPALAGVPIMMISNYPEAQSKSVEAGGVMGFGKASVGAAETIERLAAFLPRSGATRAAATNPSRS